MTRERLGVTATYVADVALFDGRSTRRRAGVLFSDRGIEWVGPHARAPRSARAAAGIDGRGKTLAPGLIDAHVHLCFDGSADFAAEAGALTDTIAVLKVLRNAAANLEAGVTTVRDLGGWRSVACEVGAQVARGELRGPTILAAGRALTITGGHGHNIGIAREVDGADALRKAVREEVRGGAAVIKLIATGGVLTPRITADFSAFELEELEAAVSATHALGRTVAAHAIGPEGIVRAVRAGVDSIEHGSLMDAAGARLMRQRGTFHVPTISALRGIVDHADEVPAYVAEKAAAITDSAREAFRRSVRLGVRVACGTDAGTPFNPHGSAPLEIVRMVEWGMTPLQAMRAATSSAADLLRLPDAGRVAPGARADLVLYDADPLEEIDAVRKPAAVWKGGALVTGAAG
jgi:imidazolonepropionase-like amidohydrolase